MEKNGRSTPSVQNTLPHQLQMFLRGWENPVLQVCAFGRCLIVVGLLLTVYNSFLTVTYQGCFGLFLRWRFNGFLYGTNDRSFGCTLLGTTASSDQSDKSQGTSIGVG
jgi:hypothetical protein